MLALLFSELRRRSSGCVSALRPAASAGGAVFIIVRGARARTKSPSGVMVISQGLALQWKYALKRSPAELTRTERFRPKQRSGRGLKDFGERLEHFGTKLQGSAHAVPAGHQVGFGRRFDFKGRHGYPSAVNSIKGCSPIVGSIGLKPEYVRGKAKHHPRELGGVFRVPLPEALAGRLQRRDAADWQRLPAQTHPDLLE